MLRSTLAMLLTLTLLVQTACAADQPRPGCQSHPHQQCAGDTGFAERRDHHGSPGRRSGCRPPRSRHRRPSSMSGWRPSVPGEELGFATGASPPSIVADVVLSGELMVLSEGRVRIQRGEGLEEVAPDTVVTIHPGEAIIYVDNQAAQTFRNPGRRDAHGAQLRGLLRRSPVDVHGGAGEPGGLGTLRSGRARSDRHGGTAHAATGGRTPRVRAGCARPARLRGGGG